MLGALPGKRKRKTKGGRERDEAGRKVKLGSAGRDVLKLQTQAKEPPFNQNQHQRSIVKKSQAGQSDSSLNDQRGQISS